MKSISFLVGARFMLLMLILCVAFNMSYAQNFPSDKQTLTDAKAAIKTATVLTAVFSSEWKLEKESGYLFSNLAKKAIQMTVKDNQTGEQRSFEGLAIYARGSAMEAWHFSRFFTYTNSIKVLGAKEDTELLKELTLKSMTEDAGQWFGDVTGVFGVYPIQIVAGSFQKVSEREMKWEVSFEVDLRWDYTYLVRRSYTKAVDAYLGQDGKTWTLDPGSNGEKELTRQEVAPAKLDQLPSISKKGFRALYGEKAAK